MSENDINLKTTFDPAKLSRELNQQIVNIFEDEYLKAVDDLQRNSPVGVSSQLGQPSLKESWDLEVFTENGEVVTRITNKAPAALNRLEGRGPGKFPPPEPIQNWVQLKLGVPLDKVKSVAFLIGRKIARQGTDRSKRNFREFNPETGESAPNSAIKRAQIRIVTRIQNIKL